MNTKTMTQKKIYGIHAVIAALENNKSMIKLLYLHKNREDKRFKLIKTLAGDRSIPIKLLNSVEISHLVGGKDIVHQGAVAVIEGKSNKNTLSSIIVKRKSKLCILVLERVQDPHNLGACIRSANSMGVDAIIVTSKHTAKDTEVVKKVSSGASENIAIFRVTNLKRVLNILKMLGVLIIGTSIQSQKSLCSFKEKEAIALIMGNEQKGMRSLTKECCDMILSIPMYGEVDSLNVSVSTSIFLYEICRTKRS